MKLSSYDILIQRRTHMRKLIIKGNHIASIHLYHGPTAPEQYAAKELAAYLYSLAGITTNGTYPVTLKIEESIGRDGYRIQISRENGLTISGGNGRGVIYGVYGFLETYAGMRFFMPDLETEGEGDILVNEGCEYVPFFEQRHFYYPVFQTNAWCLKRGINHRITEDLPEEIGGGVNYAPGMWCHSMQLLTGADQENKQPCLSDPALLAPAIGKIRKILEANPHTRIISVSMNDNKKYCQCEKCAAIDAEEGSHMGTLLRFVNAIADDIAKDYPDIIVDTIAYHYSRVPTRITRPRPNVCIRYCTISACFAHALDEDCCGYNQEFKEELTGWCGIHDRVYVWDYIVNFSHYIPPYPNFEALRRNMRFFADHGVKGIFSQGYGESPNSGEFHELRAYLTSKLQWNPFMTEEEYYGHMDEFLAAYYGAGWKNIRFFIDWTTKEARKHYMKCYFKPFQIIDRESYANAEETIDAWWTNAEALAGDRLEYVKRAKMQWRYIKLMLHPDQKEGEAFYNDIVKWNIQWRENTLLPNDPGDFGDQPVDWWNDGDLPWLTPEEKQHQADIKQARAERAKLGKSI